MKSPHFAGLCHQVPLARFYARKAIMKRNLPVIFAVLLAAVGVSAQAAGIDIQSLASAHPEVFSGLASLGFLGAIKTQGTSLFVLDPENDTVLDVGCVTALDGVDSTRDQIETTCLNSGDREYEAGLGTPGTATFTINIDPSNPVHIRLYELKQSGETLKWAIGWGDGPKQPDGTINLPPTGVGTDGDFILPTGRSWLLFSGFLSSFPFSFALNSVVTSNVGIQISGSQILVPKV